MVDELFRTNGKPNFPSHQIWTEVALSLLKEHNISLKPKTIYNYVLLNNYNLVKIASDPVHEDADSIKKILLTVTMRVTNQMRVTSSLILKLR